MHLILQSAGEGHSVRRFARLARRVISRLLRSRPGKPRGLHFSFLEAAGGGIAGRGGTEEQAAGSTSSGGNRHKGWFGAIPGIATRLGHPRHVGSLENTLIQLRWSGKSTARAGNLRQIPRESRGVSRGCGPHASLHPPAGNSAVPAPHGGPRYPRGPGHTTQATWEQRTHFILKLVGEY